MTINLYKVDYAISENCAYTKHVVAPCPNVAMEIIQRNAAGSEITGLTLIASQDNSKFQLDGFDWFWIMEYLKDEGALK